jgi:hypothetical protein
LHRHAKGIGLLERLQQSLARWPKKERQNDEALGCDQHPRQPVGAEKNFFIAAQNQSSQPTRASAGLPLEKT